MKYRERTDYIIQQQISFLINLQSNNMSNRLFDVAQSMQGQEVKKLINIYSKVQKESEEVIKRVIKKQQLSLPTKQISSDQIIKMVSKQGTKGASQIKQSAQKKPVTQNKLSIKQTISHLKQQISCEQKHLNKTKKPTKTASKEELEYSIFRLKMLAKRVTNFELGVQRALMKDAFQCVKWDWERARMLEAKFVLKRYKNMMRKYFNEFYKQTMIMRIEREKSQYKAEIQRQERNDKVSQDFREFTLCRRSIRAWKLHSEKIKAETLTEKIKMNNQVFVEKEKDHLKSKLTNFIQKIREDIHTNEEIPKQEEVLYNTIKEELGEQQESMQSGAQIWSNQYPDKIEEANSNTDIVEPPKSSQIPKKMTNEELIKKRQQLQLKNKQRKQVLDKLKKQKEELKLKSEEQRKIEQERLKQAERKRNKEQHEKFIQKRKEEEERKKKEQAERKRMDDNYILAEKHNQLRIMKYKGLLPWKMLMVQKSERLNNLIKTLVKCQLSYNWRVFKQGYFQLSSQIEEEQREKLIKVGDIYKKRMKRKVLQTIRIYNSTVAKDQNKFLQEFRNGNLLRQMFNVWKKQIPSLKQQNYHLETKQNKLIDKFRYEFLLKAGFTAFLINKEETQRERRILEHKIKIKQKMEEVKSKKTQINIDQLL